MPERKKPTKKTSKSTIAAKVETENLINDTPLSKAEQININQLISQALIRYKHEQFYDKKQKFKEIGHLAGICEEYLSSFALIGYTLEGEKVVVFNHPTPKDEAALVDLLRLTFIELANNQS
jgi:hypothetical protein